MPRYWVIAPIEHDNRRLFENVWTKDLDNKVISVGWSRLGDVSGLSPDALFRLIVETYPEKRLQSHKLYTEMLWTFFHEIVPGDFVIARKGIKILAAIGMVTKAAHYDDKKYSDLGMPEVRHPNLLDVEWQKSPRDRDYNDEVFPRPTVRELSTCMELSEEQRRCIRRECVGSVAASNEMTGLDVSNDAEDYFPPPGDWRKVVAREVKARHGQEQFRKSLCNRYGGRCLVTGWEVNEALEAAHIHPYRGDKDNHVKNGLILRADIHKLFDLYLIGIEPDSMQIELHPNIAKSKEYGELSGTTLRCLRDTRPSLEALKERYEEFNRRLKTGRK